MGFTINVVRPQKDKVEINLEGMFDEFAELPELDLNGASQVTVNFEGLTLLNSGGTKKWVYFIDQMANQDGLEVVYQNCPRVVVKQASLVGLFAKEQCLGNSSCRAKIEVDIDPEFLFSLIKAS